VLDLDHTSTPFRMSGWLDKPGGCVNLAVNRDMRKV
jgi:hypothetical protein